MFAQILSSPKSSAAPLVMAMSTPWQARHMQTTLAIKEVLCAYLANLASIAQVAGPDAWGVPLQQATQASSLLRVHHLPPNAFVQLALVAPAARSALP
jgi:hypothetical protein